MRVIVAGTVHYMTEITKNYGPIKEAPHFQRY